MSSRRWTDEELDRLVKEALLENLNQDPPLNTASAYQDFKRRKKEAQKGVKHGLRRRLLIPVGVLFLLLVYVAAPMSTNALQQITFFWQKMRGDTLNIMMGSNPPSFENRMLTREENSMPISPISFRKLSLEEIEELHGFPAMYPRMEELELTECEAMFLREKIIEIYLTYVDISTKTELKIIQKDMEDSGFGMMISEEDTERKELVIAGEPALYIAYDTGFKEIIWRKDGFLLTVEGELAEERLIKIANSIR